MATVLYVDDQQAISRAVRQWLTRKGHHVLLAASGEEARRVVASERLDGVFVDVWLGTESGIDLVLWIRRTDPGLSGRIAFVTGDLFDDALAQHPAEIPVIHKPFEFRDLEGAIERWLRDAAASFSRGAESIERRAP